MPAGRAPDDRYLDRFIGCAWFAFEQPLQGTRHPAGGCLGKFGYRALERRIDGADEQFEPTLVVLVTERSTRVRRFVRVRGANAPGHISTRYSRPPALGNA